MSAPFFSVLTPSYNQAAFLAGCVDSVLEQADPDFEHLVADNCSEDGTGAVLARYPHLQVAREPDRGQSDALNRLFRRARGEILCWLNSDDAYPPGVFRCLRQVFADPAVQVVFGDVRQVAYDGAPPQVAEARFENRLDLVRWWTSRARLHQPAIFFRSAARRATGELREDLHYAMDYEFWWRMSERFAFVRIPQVLAIQHRQPDSKTVLAWQKVYEERERIFSPYYGLIDGGNRRALLREMRSGLADRYLGEAYAAAAGGASRAALRLLVRSFLQAPTSIANPRWLGLVRRCL